MNKSAALCLTSMMALSLLTSPARGRDQSDVAAVAHRFDWPCWRGPDRNGVSRETELNWQWPEEGPPKLWQADVGIGFSSIAVAQNRVFTLGNKNEQDTIFCFDADTGQEIWTYCYDSALDPKYYKGGPGASPTAARLAGIRTNRNIMIGFLASALAAGLSGLILLSQVGGASVNANIGLELTVVTAVVLGGASLAGGRGGIVGTILAVLLLGVLANGLIQLRIPSFWIEVFGGVLLLVAVGFDQVRIRLTKAET